jgi:hypothetical protein
MKTNEYRFANGSTNMQHQQRTAVRGQLHSSADELSKEETFVCISFFVGWPPKAA